LAVPLYAAVWIGTNTLQGTNRLVYWNLARLLPTAGWLLLLVSARIWGERDPVYIVVGYVAVLGCSILPILALAGRVVQGSFRPSKSLVRPMLRYGLPL